MVAKPMVKSSRRFSPPYKPRPAAAPAARDKAASPDSVLYLGIDLGTSQSSIASSTGIRRTVQSIVAWPKDLVSQKVVKKPIVFGDEALRHRLAVDLYYPLERGVVKKGTTRDQEAAMQLIKHLIEMAPRQSGEKLYVVIGAPAEASVVDQQSLIDGARDFVDAVMVVSEPFSVAYGLSALDNSLVIDIGAGTVDLCRMHGTFPQPG
ncbi:MAG: rod shape-determining protein, partial [Acidobacteriota bacterium]